MTASLADPPEVVGIRNVLRARWKGLPFWYRVAVTVGIELLVAIGLFFVDRALGYAVATVAALLWLRRLPPLPWRLAGELVLISIFLFAGVKSLAAALAIAFAVFWVPPRYRTWVLPVAAIALAVLYPFYASKMFVIPVFGVWPDVATGVYMLVFIMMAVGLNIVVGYAGLLDLGYVAFYAMGAYTAAWFSSLQFPTHLFHFGAVGIAPDLPGIHISLWLLLPLAGVVTALAGIIIGLPTLRLRGDYLAIVTLGFGEIIPQVVRNGNSFFGYNVTNGPAGLTGIDPMGFGHQLHSWFPFIPVDFTIQYNPDKFFYWSLVVMLAFTLFCMVRLRDSRLGRAWIAIREDEDAASAMGIPLMRTKTYAYAIGAFFGGGAGCIFAFYKGATFPNDFYLNISIFILCMVILGGMGNV
ncbi:MAG: branched-chain amino acid transport system permease protein, partial [Gaiellaceae bacterium]|nr:branched-chain amino acid transport system permease protein [Gaiellaceae bacterium]